MGDLIEYDEFEMLRFLKCQRTGKEYICQGGVMTMDSFAPPPCEALPAPTYDPMTEQPPGITPMRDLDVTARFHSFLDNLRNMLIHWLHNTRSNRTVPRKGKTQ